jgi:hypothetical protein
MYIITHEKLTRGICSNWYVYKVYGPFYNKKKTEKVRERFEKDIAAEEYYRNLFKVYLVEACKDKE